MHQPPPINNSFDTLYYYLVAPCVCIPLTSEQSTTTELETTTARAITVAYMRGKKGELLLAMMIQLALAGRLHPNPGRLLKTVIRQ